MSEKTAAEQLAEDLAADRAEGDEQKAPEKGAEKAQEAPEKPDAPETPEKPEAPEKGAEGAPKSTEKADEVVPLVKADGTPYTKADIDGLNTALKAARTDAKNAARELAELKGKTGDRTVEQIEQEAATAAEQTWKPRLVRQAARAAFAEAGLSLPSGREAEAVSRAVRLLDLDALKVDDEGGVEGLAEQIEGIRTDFPDLFAGSQPKRSRIQAGDRQGPGAAPKGAAELIAAQLLGR